MRPLSAFLSAAIIVIVSPALLRAEMLTLDYSTYLGGSDEDSGRGIALGTGGEAYVTGIINSPDFPTGNPYQTGYGGSYDAFVSKLSSSGSSLIYSTYLGGTGTEIGNGIGLGTGGEAYVTGYTSSRDYPTVNPYQASYKEGIDVFVSKLDSSGSDLLYSTYFGGSDVDYGYGIALGTGGEAYVTGRTVSTDFPTNNPYQASFSGLNDIFVSRLSSSGSGIVYSTYLGGSYDDRGYGIALGVGDEAYVTGRTSSPDFPTKNPYQAGYGGGGYDVFVSRLSSTGSGIIYSTYLGGSQYDYGYGLALGSGGEAYVTGNTDSPQFPTNNPYQTSIGGIYDAFVSKLDPSGSDLLYSTYLGGSAGDEGAGIALGAGGDAYVIGSTESPDFPTDNPYQASSGGLGPNNVFVSKLDSSGSDILYSTYLGGNEADWGYGITLGTDGAAYITGDTYSRDFPTRNPYQAGYKGLMDAFVTKLNLLPTPSPVSSPTPSPTPSPTATPVPSATPSPQPSATPSPTPTATPSPTPSPSPSPTIYRCFDVSGQATDGITGQPIDGIQVQAFVTGDYSSSVGTGDANGLFTVRPCTHYTDGIVRAEARKRGYLPAFSTAPYASWSEVTGISIQLIPSLLPQGVVSSDYDGNGTTDTVVFQLPERIWAVRNVTRIYFGGETDELVPADYDGDGTTNACIFRPANGSWAIHNLTRYYFGSIGAIPIPGDYNGDGTGELAVVRAWDSLWSVRGFTRFYLGSTYDQPVPRDFSGDGIPDPGMYRRSGGMWAIRNVTRVYFGSSDDLVPGDFTGSGTWEPGIFRESTSLWSIRNVTRLYLGSSGDWAVPADYDHDGADEAGVFRNSSGLWSVFNTTRMYFGGPDDIPVTR